MLNTEVLNLSVYEFQKRTNVTTLLAVIHVLISVMDSSANAQLMKKSPMTCWPACPDQDVSAFPPQFLQFLEWFF